MGLEPAFANRGKVWPLAGLYPLPAEPDDPDFAIPAGSLVLGLRDKAEPIILRDVSFRLNDGPAEPLDISRSRPPERGRKWRFALLASCVFHAAVAMFFVSAVDDDVLMEGAEQAGIMMQGSAPDDQVSAGEVAREVDVTNVTLITMLEATAVETVDAQAVPVEDLTPTIETAETVVASADVLEPVVEQPAEPVSETPVEPTPETVAAPETSTSAPAAPASPTETALAAEAAPLAYAAPALEVLATDTLEPVEDENVVQKPSEITRAEPVEPAEVAPSQTSDVVTAEAEPEPVKPEPAPKPVEKKQEAKKAEPKKAEAKPEPKKKVEPKKPAKTAAAAKPEKPASKKNQKTKAGNGGQNPVDAKRGAPDGEARGNTTAKSKGKSSSVGNAAVSNYPGKVLAKLRRSLRGIPRSAISRARNDVQVSFVVNASGGVGSVRISRSSGSPELDSAALAVVRRAAPFPPIPSEAGRSSWQFTLPLGLAR